MLKGVLKYILEEKGSEQHFWGSSQPRLVLNCDKNNMYLINILLNTG